MNKHTFGLSSRSTRRLNRPGRKSQNGMVLIVALVLLLAMTLAGALLLRSVGAGQGVAGNLAFKQNATSSADRGVEAVRTWFLSPHVPSDFEQNHFEQGYFASWAADFNPLTYNWIAENASVELPVDDNGNRVFYVVHRLCKTIGSLNAATQQCVMPKANVKDFGPACAGSAEDCAGSKNAKTPYYRITTRVEGPRNTVSYVQVVMF